MSAKTLGGASGALGRDVNLLYTLNFLSSFAYHLLYVLFVMYATNEFGMSDVDAGMLYGWWGILTSLWSGAMSFAIDILGVKVMSLAGALLLCVVRTAIALTRSAEMLRFLLLGLSPIVEGLNAPVYMVAIKLVTCEEHRALAYSINYAVHNAGGGVADVLIDVLRRWHSSDPAAFTRVFGDFTPVRICLLSTVVALAINASVACALPARLNPRLRKDYSKFWDDEDMPRDASRPWNGVIDFLRTTCGLLWDRNLRFVACVASCLVWTKMQWHHINATLPKYLVRELGEDVPWASVNSINYWMCAVLPPLVAMGSSGWRDFRTIVIGSAIMSVGPIFMVLQVSLKASCAWLVVLSLGEVMWSPRFNTLSANLSPSGREGAFLVLAYIPQFFAAMPTGWFSGLLLQWYCPDCPSCRDGRTGSFCSIHCDAPGAPSCPAGAQCVAPSGVGSCHERHWVIEGLGSGGGTGGCPSSCAACPGWAERANGPRLWACVLAISMMGPLLLLLLASVIPMPEVSAARATESTSQPSVDGLELEGVEGSLGDASPAPVMLGNRTAHADRSTFADH